LQIRRRSAETKEGRKEFGEGIRGIKKKGGKEEFGEGIRVAVRNWSTRKEKWKEGIKLGQGIPWWRWIGWMKKEEEMFVVVASLM
jgi:hypothetical protein